jgi:hypothetical protein
MLHRSVPIEGTYMSYLVKVGSLAIVAATPAEAAKLVGELKDRGVKEISVQDMDGNIIDFDLLRPGLSEDVAAAAAGGI